MPSFSIWTLADLGMPGLVFNGGPYTVGSNATTANVDDDDFALTSSQVETSGPQTLASDLILDGSLAGIAGTGIYTPGKVTITNHTTGQTSDLLYISTGTSGLSGFIGFASKIPLNIGDSFSISSYTTIGGSKYVSLVTVPCLTRGTKIRTEHGETPVEKLKKGDKIFTSDHGMQPIRWIGARKVSHLELKENPKLYPIRIQKGALGKGLPKRDLRVSRQHRMLISSKIAKRMFNIHTVLIPAHKLIEIPGIDIDVHVRDIEYTHILFDKHTVIFAEGAPTESLYTGKEALASICTQARHEIYSLFPELIDQNHITSPAFPFPSGKKQKELIGRHSKNKKPLLELF